MAICVTCGGELKYHREYDFRSDAFRKVYEGKEVFRCTQCGLSQVDVGKIDENALQSYYEDDYRNVAQTGALTDITSVFYDKRARALSGIAKKEATTPVSRVFEVGAGYGYNLLAMQKIFPESELFTDEVSNSVPRADVINKASLEDGNYDVIILSHVLEHFTDPQSLLKKCSSALSSKGVIVLEVPNDVDDIERYNVVDEPHLTFFELPTLRALVNTVDELRLVDLWEAGPSNKAASTKRRLRRAVGRILNLLPVVSNWLKNRRSSNVTSLDFEQRNPDGVFLRAVLTRSE